MEARRLTLLCAVALGACRSGAAVTPRSAQPVDLSERETVGDRLIVVNYPQGFQKIVQEDGLFLFGPQGGVLQFRVQIRPMSEDLNELGRTPPCPDTEVGTVSNRTQRTATCFAGLTGLERSCLFTPKAGRANQHFSWDCLFVKNHRQFTCGYSVPSASRAEVGPLLERVIAASEAN